MDKQQASESARQETYVHADDSSFRNEVLGQRTADQRDSFFLQRLRPGMRLLDCGCGPGATTMGLAAAVAPGETVGIDIIPASVEAAWRLAQQQKAANVRFEVGSVYQLPFPDRSFDAVYAQALFLHLGEPLTALREIRRVLRPGGFVGIVDSDLGTSLIAPLFADAERIFELQVRAIEHHGGRPYGARSLRPLLAEAGFTPTEGGAFAQSFGSGPKAAEVAANGLRRTFLSTAPVWLEQGWVTQEELDGMNVELDAWARRTDTFNAVTFCTGLGWVPD